MAYSTLTDLTRWLDEQELVRLCSKDPDDTISSAGVAAVATVAIQNADAEIDSHLLTRWPALRGYTPVPDEINRLSACLAVYNLYLRRRAVSENWRRCYEDCLARLQAAARGESSLGLDEQGQTAAGTSRNFRTDTVEEDRVFTPAKLKKF